jgi:Tol biopolymer transport system component
VSITGSNTDEWPLIPRKRLLGNPSRIDPKLSPDGSRLAWQAPVDGVMNIWVAPTDEISQAQPVTRLGGRPPGWHGWSADGRFVLFFKDENGDENYNLYAVDPANGEVRNLTPLPKVSVRLFLLSRDLAGSVWIGLNDRDARWHDVWSLDLANGERKATRRNK